MRERRPLRLLMRPELANAIEERRLTRTRHVWCPRCQEEVTRSTMWCPHCGYDLTTGGGIERRRKTHRAFLAVLHETRAHFKWGLVAGLVVSIVTITLQLNNLNHAELFAGCCFCVTMWSIGGQLSLRALAALGPTLASTLAYLMLH